MRAILGVAVYVTVAALTGSAGAQQVRQAPAHGNQLERDALNANTVTVITAPIGGPMSIMGSDMAAVLDDGDKLRVLPILGKGSVQNLIDIIRLKNIDMGFVTSDALEFVKTEYNIPDIAQRVRYIAPLFHNAVHIVAREEIKTLQDLNGKRIFAERSIGLPAARIVFRRMGIEADIDLQTDPDGGLQKLLDGERDAWIASVSKNAPVIKNIKNEGGKVPSAADSVCEAAAGHLPALVLLVRGLSEPRAPGRQGQFSRCLHGADGLQLAGRKRSLSARCQVRRRLVRQARPIASASPKSEMEGYHRLGRRPRIGAFQGRPGLARQEQGDRAINTHPSERPGISQISRGAERRYASFARRCR